MLPDNNYFNIIVIISKVYPVYYQTADYTNSNCIKI